MFCVSANSQRFYTEMRIGKAGGFLAVQLATRLSEILSLRCLLRSERIAKRLSHDHPNVTEKLATDALKAVTDAIMDEVAAGQKVQLIG